MSKFLEELDYLEKSRQITYAEKIYFKNEYNSLDLKIREEYDQYSEKKSKLL